MAKNTDVLPFAELEERTAELSRTDAQNDRPRVRGAVQDTYLRRLPNEEDWTFFLATSAITCDAEYKTGTVSVNTQASAATFSSDTTITAAMTGRKIKFSDNPDVYDFVQANATSVTLTPVLSGDRNITNGAYSIFNPTYTLPTDFDRFPRGGGLLLYQGGRPTVIPEEQLQKWWTLYTASPGTPTYCRLAGVGTDGRQQVEVTPGPQKAINLVATYLKRPTPLRSTTAGTVTVAAGSTTATVHGGATLLEAGTGWYFRVDAFGTGADSEWYRVSTLNVATSSLTLQLAFGVSGATSAGYTLSAAPELPIKLHPAVLFGAVTTVMADQNDPLYQAYDLRYREVIAEGKRLYKSRPYVTEVDTVFKEYHYRR